MSTRGSKVARDAVCLAFIACIIAQWRSDCAEKPHRWLNLGPLDRAAALLSNRDKTTAIEAARGRAGACRSRAGKTPEHKCRDREERCGRNACRGRGYISQALGAQR